MKECFSAFCCGNCIKYIYRWKQKNGKEDLEKARVYYGWMGETNYTPRGMDLINAIGKILEKAEREFENEFPGD